MRLKLFMLLTLFLSLNTWAQSGLRGIVIDSRTSVPVVGATVLLDEQGVSAITGPSGDFVITDAKPGSDRVMILCYGYRDLVLDVTILNGIDDLGTIKLTPSSSEIDDENNENAEIVLTESMLEDEEGNTQQVGALTGATDNPYYKATNYNFSTMRFRIRGYNNEYSQTYINGINFNDAARGRFNYSMIGGMNQAFRSRSVGYATEATSFGFGDVGGATNIFTYAKDYAPGFRGSIAYTNSNYRWRGMITYSTGLNQHGWALTLSAIARYAGEGIIPGSFYNSWGAFLSLQKVLNSEHSVSLTVFGAPTKRASNSATFDEAYQLAGSNLYNTNWGWQEGKKRNARVVQSFDPTAILSWIWTPKTGTTLNTGLAFHKSFYSSSALNWYNSRDPRPDYYRYLPSYYRTSSPETADLFEWEWLNMEEKRQLNWANLYQINYLNNYEYENGGEDKGSSYVIENRHSNQFNWMLSSNLNMRLTEKITLQGGVSANYSRSSYYKTMKDLLGGRYWLDVDQYAERDFPGDAELLQNDLDNPNRRIMEKDRFGYDYNINSITGRIWAQNVINLSRFDINYGVQVSATSFQRDGNMRNGRAPENSKGKGDSHSFINYALKAGAIFKIDGRNNIQLHAYYGTRAPEYYNAYISPRIKDDVITDLKSARVLSGDIGYVWNYRNFMGSITGFWTEFWDMTERTSFYDDYNSTFVNYALTGVQKEHKGVEIGAAYKITPSLTLNAAATIARYQYKNRPTGTRSFENGSVADVTQTVYLKNFYVSGTPQEAYSLGFNWSAPKMWFFEINGVWMNRSYVDLFFFNDTATTEIYTKASSEQELMQMMQDIGKQEKLNEALIINMSIGKVIYLNRSASLNLNLSLNNLLNNTSIQTGGYQQGRFDYNNYTTAKFPNKYYYAQGFRMYLNVGVRF